MPTEDGWEPSPRIEPNSNLLVWRKVPGANVTIQVRNDDCGKLMLAYAADYHAYVEPLVDDMTACYTPTNSVSTSNHLNATAMDFNWRYYPWKIRGRLTGDKLKRLRELLKFYENYIYWAGDWDDAYVDEMHHQMDYGSYELFKSGELSKWVKANIRADGFSIYKRNSTIDPALVLSAATGLSYVRAAQILPTMQQGLQMANCNNERRIAMFIGQTRHESDNYNTTVEYGRGAGKEYYPYYGRGWIQVTWQGNYQRFGQWAAQQGLIDDPDKFVKDPDSLADIKWAGISAAWYWTVERPAINAMCDDGDIRGVTKAINGGYNGLDKRETFYNLALAQGSNLLALTANGEDDDMPGVDIDRLNRAVDKILGVWPSRSIYRDNNDNVDDTVGMLLNVDGSVHEVRTENRALMGDPEAIALVKRTADGNAVEQHPDSIAQAKRVYERAIALNTPKPTAKSSPRKSTK